MSEPLNPEVAILNAALELPAVQRAAYLDKACSGNDALRRQVEELLTAHEHAEDFLEGPVEHDFKRTGSVNIPITEKPGDKIGRYKLLQPLGEGGCGVVYLAEQEEPVRRRVALKVIKLGMDTKQVIARFEAERQALALMDHPNIARVLEAGATEAGRPYFVMELVHGVKITDYCDENNVSTEDRLKLFIQVCQAIQHAHQKGIIHRDIKPSNILVTVNDGVPVPKVIDFGIAKATQGRLTDRTLFTAFEQFIGTPAYMSPEQTVMTSLDIDTRSDIYSLGVLLYELLTGRTPFDQKELLACGFDEMRRTIREKEPVKPSTRLTQELGGAQTRRLPLPATLERGEGDLRASSRRLLQVKELIRVLRGDLDWIVMKCLEKDRSRRYETANGLVRDIERHLRNEPVMARPPSALYQFRKLVQRNKLVFAAVGVLAVALLIVAIGSAVAAWRVASARRAEHHERQKAETANHQLRQTVSLLELQRAEDLFGANDSAAGVAHLAAMLRRDPSNHIAASRLVSAMVHRSWALPSAPPRRHLERVATASFSPDGRHVVSASWDKTAKVWDTTTGLAVATVRHDDQLFSARFSPEGQRFVTASADGTAGIWSATDGSPLTPLLRHEGKIYGAEFSHNGRFVVTASADKTARIWDASSGALKWELRGHSSEVLFARFSPDGERVATGSDIGSMRIWSVASGKMLLHPEGHRERLHALAFSPDGRRIISACRDGTARLWNPTTGEAIGGPLMHNDRRENVWHATFSPDSHRVLTTSQDNTARLWDAETGQSVEPRLLHEGGVRFGEFSPAGNAVVTTSADNSARLWDVRTGMPLCQPLREHELIRHASFSPDGRRLVTAADNWNVQVWDIQPRRFADMEVRHANDVTSVAFSPRGEAVLTASLDKTARLWNARTGQPLGGSMNHESAVQCADISADGKRAVTASSDGTARVWDLSDARVIAGPLRHGGRISFAQFSPDGEQIVTASVDRTARVWDARTGEPITPPLAHKDEILMARFSPDGRYVATASDDWSARLWDARTGQPVTDRLSHIDQVKWADFSPDGERVVTAAVDDTARIWDVRTGKPVAPPLQHARSVYQAAFSPDGRRVVTASLDRSARIWDAATGQALTEALQHNSPVSRVCFSPDGRRILTGTWSGAVRIWDSNTGKPLTEWLNADGHVFSACFDPTGRRVAAGAKGGIVRVWNVPEAPDPVPAWWLSFAEAVAGIRLSAHGNMELVPRSELDRMAWQSARKDSNEFYGRLATWFLADPANRPVTPF